MGQKSIDIENVENGNLDLIKSISNTEEKNNETNSEEKIKGKKKKISRENKMQIREFLDFLEFEKGSSQNTVTGYNRDLIQFFLFVQKNFSEIEEKDIFKYIEKLNEKLRRNSVLRKVSALKTFYKFCYLNRDVEKDPTGMVKTLKREQRLPEILTLKEMKQIVDNCPHTPEGMRNKLIIKILIATGARISEILNLEIKDVENQDYEFIKVLGKGSKYRIIPIYDSLENEIKNYLTIYRPKLKNASESFKIFPNTRREKFWKDLKTIAKNAKIEKNVYPHIFRHSLATILLGNGADVRIVQEILGHANITTTEIYTHVEKSKLKMIYDNIKLGDD
ncbi:tyrosine-type recombinase/integrase [Leptotrichia sp. oral taxon 223]|uniref:tyrosine-type recombinase/integrase n=1 Tax=Leptotrichia sp. oral taxon 223 TaxID=712363 RepID=UPI0015BE3FE0|nr:tyrosine-type recombinase/integrase [Leptotrichia sp. oral taxon 223]NWO18588.1 tyrosine-type recombinase/integrase [Leptotrichia sp. oral taxon 223]